MLRYVGLVAGALLVWYGGALAWSEFDLADARLVARERGPKGLKASDEALDRAYAALTAVPGLREDVIVPVLEITLQQDLRGPLGDTARMIVVRRRISDASHTLVRAAPLNARAWCVLALSTAKAGGLTEQAAEQLKACYDFAPREVTVMDGRLAFALAAWEELPLGVRNAAMIDVAAGLGDAVIGGPMADRLAFLVATSVPQRAELADKLVEQYGKAEIRSRYARALANYRRAVEARGGR